MVLESLFSAEKVERKPIDMLLLSFIVSVACVFIAWFVFPAYAGIIFPLMVAVAFAPLIYRLFSLEEKLEHQQAAGLIKRKFWDRHDEIIKIFSMFFIGNLVAVFLLVVLLPEGIVLGAFAQQFDEISAIRSISAAATSYALNPTMVEVITLNNLKVMAFAFMLSFLLGTGAMFILSWNASILGIYFGNFVRQGLYHEFLMQSFGIFPHALIEVVAYFLAGIAGGILSAGMMRERFMSPGFRLVLKDSLLLMFLAVAAVVLGAVVEVAL